MSRRRRDAQHRARYLYPVQQRKIRKRFRGGEQAREAITRLKAITSNTRTVRTAYRGRHGTTITRLKRRRRMARYRLLCREPEIIANSEFGRLAN